MYYGTVADMNVSCTWSTTYPGNDKIIPQLYMLYASNSGCNKMFGNESIYRFECGSGVFKLTILNIKSSDWNSTKWICELKIFDKWKGSESVTLLVTEKANATTSTIDSLEVTKANTTFIETSHSFDVSNQTTRPEAEKYAWREYILLSIAAGCVGVGIAIGVVATLLCNQRKHGKRQPSSERVNTENCMLQDLTGTAQRMQANRSSTSARYEQLVHRNEVLYETIQDI
ncbi:uncharacterized protein LOC127837482 isoform X2 [Dreissena polymorpha]|nr:uncharacterized protein LOC127837482 isoform X2 [Dreissena polymorpha]